MIGPARRFAALRARDREAGSAIAEFVMVSILVVFVAMSVLQLAMALYVRNAVIEAAAEGARYGARANSSPELGAQRTRSMVSEQLNASYAERVTATRKVIDGVRVVEITVSAPVPVIGLLGPSEAMTLSARAFEEGQ